MIKDLTYIITLVTIASTIIYILLSVLLSIAFNDVQPINTQCITDLGCTLGLTEVKG